MLEADRDQAVRTYCQQRKEARTFAIAVEIENIKAAHDYKLPHMRLLRKDEQRILYYKDVICSTWKLITESPWGTEKTGYNFEHHALSILYLMRVGLKASGVFLIPRDEYLLHLPLRIDLPKFGYKSNTVTEGIKRVKNAYADCAKQGYPVSRLIYRPQSDDGKI